MHTRRTATFETPLGSFTVYVEPTIRELELVENDLGEFFEGSDKYRSILSEINELDQYRVAKNEESLGVEGFKKLRDDYGAFLSSDIPTDEAELKIWQEKNNTFARQFYLDGRVALLNDMRAKVQRAKDICLYARLVVEPKGFDPSTLTANEYIAFRQALEDCLTRFHEAQNATPAPGESGSQGANK